MSKYANGHVQIGLSLRDVLKKKALNKEPNKLVRSDFKNWFVTLWWKKSKSFGLSDENGNEMSDHEKCSFVYGMYRV